MPVNVPMGKVAHGGASHAAARCPATRRAKLELVVDVDGAHANTWSFWSFPRGGLLDRAAVPVHLDREVGGHQRGSIRSCSEGARRRAATACSSRRRSTTPRSRHLRAGGRVWLMAERGQTQARAEVGFFPAAGGALGTVIRDHPALRGLPARGVRRPAVLST